MHIREGSDRYHEWQSGERDQALKCTCVWSVLSPGPALFHCTNKGSLVSLPAASLGLLKETSIVASLLVSSSHLTPPADPQAPAMIVSPHSFEGVRASSITYV